MLVEMNDMYVHSVKSSIAEYVLLNPKERERLQVAPPSPLQGNRLHSGYSNLQYGVQ